MTHSKHHPLPPRDDRETLSALFDGELPGDAARFALKRLDHDAEWRETCGRWQLIGDALRGEATSAAPVGFAAGVMQQLAAEAPVAVAVQAPAQAAGASAPAGSRRRWFGGAALAATVAMAAVLVVRPFAGSSAPAADAPIVASAARAAVATPATSTPTIEAATAAPATQSAPDAALAVAEADRSPASPPRPANRAVRAQVARADDPRVRPQQDEPTTAVAIAATASASRKPFHPATDDIVTRPWPRAVLSEGASGALTVGFGSSTAAPSSLYPFEPRLPPDSPQAQPQR